MKTNLPPPTNFAEGQRLVYGRVGMLAGLAIGLGATFLALVLIYGGWGESHYARIIDILGWTLLAAVAIMALVIIGLFVGGPVGRFKGGVSKDGVNFEAGGREDRETTVTVTEKSGGSA